MSKGNNVRLTDRFIERLKPGSERRLIFDSMVPGLILVLMPNGRRIWYHGCRVPEQQNWTKKRIGEWVADGLNHSDAVQGLGMPVDAARRMVLHRRSVIAAGIDPDAAAKAEAEQARAEQRRASSRSVGAIVDAWYNARGVNLAHAREAQRTCEAVKEQWGERSVADLEPSEIAAYFTRMPQSTPRETVNRYGLFNSAIRWAIGVGMLTFQQNPCAALSAKQMFGRKTRRDRCHTDAELKAIWHACGQLPGESGRIWGVGVKLLMLSALRRDEIFAGEWAELDFAKRQWVIPGSRMKMGLPYVLPVSDFMVELLQGLPRISEQFIFALNPGNAFNAHDRYLKQLRLLSNTATDARGNGDWHMHDFRRSCRSRWTQYKLGDHQAREAALAHAKGAIHGTYDVHDLADEKRALLEGWERVLLGILSPGEGGDNVLPFPRTAA
jgi:integrase